ncbi:hypothetical protein [Azospirillum argentinense]|uniref:Uncharacterized protein n=1 Tax=Azospirillum brasilense TaxID=192 RepID=A0A4D8Q5I9_AZOBR|nr:hypothetical protein [Azospirillum argentinense]QCO05847.1 hypothetical protein D3867_28635 [Azospirillum argentinense]
MHPAPLFGSEAVEAHRAALTTGSVDLGMAPESVSGLAKAIARAIAGTLPIPSFPDRLIPLVLRLLPGDGGGAV